MNYVTTNIRLPEDIYLALKEEAFKDRSSLAALIRKRIALSDSVRKKSDTARFKAQLNATAIDIGKKLRGFDVVKAIREMREER